jgi:hypothetical protein
MTYETPQIDLGIDVYIRPYVTSTGEGTPAYEMKTGLAADGGVAGAWKNLDLVLCRYLKIKTEVTGTAARRATQELLVDGERVVESWPQINTASYAETNIFERVAAGHVKVKTRGGMSAISNVAVSFHSVGGVRTFEIVALNAAVGGQGPAAEIKFYNAAGALVDAVATVELTGPKVA